MAAQHQLLVAIRLMQRKAKENNVINIEVYVSLHVGIAPVSVPDDERN